MVWGFLSSLTGHSASNSKALYVFCEVVLDSAMGVLLCFVLKTDQGHCPCDIGQYHRPFVCSRSLVPCRTQTLVNFCSGLFGWQSQNCLKRNRYFMIELHIFMKRHWHLILIHFFKKNFFGEKIKFWKSKLELGGVKMTFKTLSKRSLFLSFSFLPGLTSHYTLSPDQGAGYLPGDISG